MIIAHKYGVTAGKILLFCAVVLLLFDYVRANGGYKTILMYSHPALPLLSIILLSAAGIWIGFNAIVMAANKQWRKASALILCLVVVAIGSKVTIKMLAEKSEKRAYDVVRLFLSKANNNFDVQLDKEVEHDYCFFLEHYDPSAIKLAFSYPPYGRYDFDIYPEGASVFTITLWVRDPGRHILIHKGIESYRTRKSMGQ